MDDIIVEEVTLIPIGGSQPIAIKPIRLTVSGRPEPLIFDAREIAAIKDYAVRNRTLAKKSD